MRMVWLSCLRSAVDRVRSHGFVAPPGSTLLCYIKTPQSHVKPAAGSVMTVAVVVNPVLSCQFAENKHSAHMAHLVGEGRIHVYRRRMTSKYCATVIYIPTSLCSPVLALGLLAGMIYI